MMKNVWMVSRQCYWPTGECVVEIAYGGLDYANADMLSDPGGLYRALGCDQEYNNPKEALDAAFKVRDKWQSLTEEEVRIEAGCTGGNTMPFEDYPSDETLRFWANKEYESLPKCVQCGELIIDAWGMDGEYCSKYCVEEVYEDSYEEELSETD